MRSRGVRIRTFTTQVHIFPNNDNVKPSYSKQPQAIIYIQQIYCETTQ